MKNNDSMMQLHVYPLGHPNMMHDSKLFSIYFIIAETKAFSFSNIIDFIQWWNYYLSLLMSWNGNLKAKMSLEGLCWVYMIIICGHMPGQWKNDEMIYVVPGQNIPKKDDVINVQSLI